jgi:hypothetical protein
MKTRIKVDNEKYGKSEEPQADYWRLLSGNDDLVVRII